MGVMHHHAGARKHAFIRTFIAASALVVLAFLDAGWAAAPSTPWPAPDSSTPGPRGRNTGELAEDNPSDAGMSIEDAWRLPPGGSPRGGDPPAPLYDNGAPLDDFGDPSSQASLEVDGAAPIWRFYGAAADNFTLPISGTNPGANYNVTTIRVAFDFFQSGSANATPVTSWTQGVYVAIFSNSPLNQPGGAPALSGGTIVFTGNVVASALVPRASLTNEVEVNTGCRTVHTVDIPVNFFLAADTTYWLSVMPRFPAPPQTAWCLSDGTAGSALPAHRGATFDVPFWTVVEGNSAFGGCSTGGAPGAVKELSFQIYAAEVQQDIGACCNTVTTACADVDRIVDPNACNGPNEVFHPATICSLLSPACDEGACCYVDQFNMEVCELATQTQCTALGGHGFYLGQFCSPDIDCTRPPDNDNCALAMSISGTNVLQQFNSANAGTEPDSPAIPPECGGAIANDIWFDYNVGCNGTLVITTINSEFDTVLAVYGDHTPNCPPCPVDSGTLLACNDDNDLDPGTNYSIVAIPVNANECLKIRIGGKPGGNPAGGEGELRIFCIPTGQGACCGVSGSCSVELEANCPAPSRWFDGQPCGSPNACLPNDTCIAPAVLQSVSPLSVAFDTSRATQSPEGQPTDCGAIEQDIWFSYVVPCNGDLVISTTGSAYDTLLAVYDFDGGAGCPDSGFCSDLAAREIVCNDDQPGGEPAARVRLPGVTAGKCLLIRVGGHDNGFATSGGDGVLTIVCVLPNEGACCFDDGTPCAFTTDLNCVAPNTFIQGEICEPNTCPSTPTNDLCTGAIELVGMPVAQAYDTTDATTDADAPLTDCGAIVQDIWFTYTVPCTGTAIISTSGTAYDAALAVYGPGTCPVACPLPAPDGNSTESVCNDDASPPALDAAVLVQVSAGDCLLIRVGGKDLSPNLNGGAGVLNIDCTTEILGACCHLDRTCDEAVSAPTCTALGDIFFPFEECTQTNCPGFPTNDECLGAIDLLDGDTPIDTTSASDSVQPVPPSPTCAQPTRDLWYRYTATCDGAARFSLCADSNFDSVIVAYEDCNDCSDGAVIIGCDNNGCGPSGHAELFLPVTESVCYLIRVGGVAGGNGTGTLTVTCGPNPVCCPGDVNRNNVVDLNDVPEFIANLLEPPAPQDPAYCALDTNNDDEVDGEDIQVFVDVLVGGLPCEELVQGSCCIGTTCIVVSPTGCASQGGDYQGNLTDCTTAPCTAIVTGACCLPDDNCVHHTLATCNGLGGDYKGDFTICEPTTCTPPPPPVDCNFTFVAELEAEDPEDDWLGLRVALEGTTVVAGAPTRSNATGAAVVFENAGGTWAQTQLLTANDGTFGEYFGWTVAMEGDRLLVGAYRMGTTSAGAVYEFERVAGTWQQGQKIQPAVIQPSRNFGNAVSLDGPTALIGALQDNQFGSLAGAAFVFNYDGTDWIEGQKLTASDAGPSHQFGFSVDMQGDLAVVGALLANIGPSMPGAAYVFERTANTWSQVIKLTAADPQPNSQFGSSVAVSGNRIVVGAARASANLVNSGAVYVFERSGNTWLQLQKLLPSDPVQQGEFGCAVQMIDDTIVIGARRSNAVYVFARQDGQWIEKLKVTSPDAVAEDQFGTSVAWDGSALVAGANLGEVTGIDTGTVHFFDLSCNGACCDNGDCSMTLSDACPGTFAGIGVQCGPASCPSSGCCVGDFSGNATVDMADIPGFVDAAIAGVSANPGLCLGDSDENGMVDGRDVELFVTAVLAGQDCTP